MIVLVVILALGLLGLVIWDRCIRAQPPTHSSYGDRDRFRPATPPAPRPGAAGRPRFQGRGVATTRPTFPTTTQTRRPTPRAAPTARFSGEVRRAPDAIGLACGRPIVECERGADCLCVD
jgi:hypothetical protein